jgi:1-acyl-sn-glycerol-3-phosphate acyltransferase
VTQRESLEPTEHATNRAGMLPELRCKAITRSGQPCRNRPVEGQAYCHVHAPLAGASSAVPAEAFQLNGESAEELLVVNNTPAERARDAVIDVVEELEVEVRNQPGGQSEERDIAADALRLIRENLMRMAPEPFQQAARLIRENLSSDYLDPDFWRGLGMVLRYQAESTAELIQRRVRGEYTTDPYGMDLELIEVVRPFLGFMYRRWWRVTAEGLEHVPGEGRALMVSNHSGVLPWDGAMIGTAIFDEHPAPRVTRCLHLSWFSTLPIVAPALAAFGQVQALPENAIRLLEDDQLVCVFPEGLKGVGKLFKDRYKLARFGRGGFVQMALRTGAPLIPVAVIGAEEIYPMLANAKPIARLIGFPYFPITPLFPWFGLLGVVPLPSKWTLVFHEPIATAQYGPQAADDPLLVSELSEQVRGRIQATIDQRVAGRKSVFFG